MVNLMEWIKSEKFMKRNSSKVYAAMWVWVGLGISLVLLFGLGVTVVILYMIKNALVMSF